MNGDYSPLSTYELRHLPAHLATAGWWAELQQLYTDLDYLEAVTGRSGPAPPTARGGIYHLLAGLEDSERRAAAAGVPGAAARELLTALRGTFSARARLLDQYPETLAQELANYVATGSADPRLSDLAADARARVRDGFVLTVAPPTTRTDSGHASSISSVAISPSGGHFLTGGADGSVGYWEAEGKGPLWLLGVHRGAVDSVGFSPDGTHAISTGTDGSFIIWEVAVAASRPLPLGARHWLYGHFGAFVDRDSVLVGVGGICRRIDVNSGRELWNSKEMLEELRVKDRGLISLAAGGSVVAVAGHAQTVLVHDTRDGKRRSEFRLRQPPKWAHLTPDGDRLLVATGAGRLTAHDSRTGDVLGSALTGGLLVLASDPRSPVFWGVRIWERSVCRIDLGRGLDVEEVPSDLVGRLGYTVLTALAVFPSSRQLLVGLESGGLAVFDCERGRVVREWPARGELLKGALFPEGGGAIGVRGVRQASKLSVGREVLFVRPSGEKQELEANPHAHFISGLAALGADSALTVDIGGTAVVWRGSTPARTYRDLAPALTACANWNGSGVCGTRDDQVLFLDEGDTVERLELPPSRLIQQQSARSDPPRYRPGIVALAAVGNPACLLLVYSSGEVAFHGHTTWETATVSMLGTTAVLDQAVRLGASGDVNGTVFIWDCATGELAHRLRLHEGEVTALAFDSDGSALFTAGTDHVVTRVRCADGRPTHRTTLPGTPIALLSESGGRLAALDASGGIVRFVFRHPVGDRPGGSG